MLRRGEKQQWAQRHPRASKSGWFILQTFSFGFLVLKGSAAGSQHAGICPLGRAELTHPLAQHGPVILGTTQCPAGASLGGSGRGGEAARETWHVSCSTRSCGRCRAHPKPLTGITISLPQSRHLRLSPLACQLDSQRRQTQDSGKICNECSRAQVGMVLHSDDCLRPSLWEPSWGS